MTSLSEQLKRLALPQTSLLTEDKKRPSLLFDPKEAATLNRDTVYQIGVDGLEGLKNKNPIFAQFENTLFHHTSKNFQRAIQTKEVNDKLDKNIAKFLRLVSPYFMLYDTYKALEWLINRYRIHEFNKEELLMLILPYHETNIFVRTLQLINLKDPTEKWHWLHSLQRPGIHLPKDTLYNHAASDPSFLRMLSKYIVSIVEEHENPAFLTVIFNFYCATFVGAINHSKELDENHVSQIMLSLVKGLKSDIADFCASAYVIAARLVAKTDLTEKILLKLIDRITIFPVDTLRSEALALLVIIYQSQKEFDTISEESLLRISEALWIVEELQKFDKDGMHTVSFVEPLLKKGVRLAVETEDGDSLRNFIIELLNALKFNDDFVGQLIEMILHVYKHKTKYPFKIYSWIKTYFDILEKQYPMAYDKVINSIMKFTQGEKLNKKQKAVQKILKTSGGNNFCFNDKLFSTLANVRKETISYMCKNFDTLKEREKDLLRNVLVERLLEDNYETAYETMRASMRRLQVVLDKETIKKICAKLLNRAQTVKDPWWKISYNAANILVKIAEPSDINVFLTLLPFLLPTAEDEFRTAKLIVNSSYGDNCLFLKSKISVLRNATYYQFFTTMFDSLSLNENLPDIKEVLVALKNVPVEDRDVLHKYISTLLLSSTLPENCPADVASGVLDILLMYLETSKLKSVKKDGGNVSNYIMMARKNKFPLEGFLQCLETLFLKTQVPNKPLGQIDFYIDNEISKFYLVVLNILVNGVFSEKQEVSLKYGQSLEKFFERFAADSIQSRIDAYLNIITSENKYVDEKLQVRCLNKVNKILGEDVVDIGTCLDVKKLTVPYILVCLLSENTGIRGTALKTLKTLATLGTGNSSNYLALIQNILTYKEEILLDHRQVPIMMNNIENEQAEKSKIYSLLNTLVKLTEDDSTPLCLRSGLNKLFSDVTTYKIFSYTVKYALTALENSELELDTQSSKIVYYNILKLQPSVASDIKIDSEIWGFIAKCFQKKDVIVNFDSKTNVPILILNQIEKDFFSKLKGDVQKEFLGNVIEVATNSQNPEILSAANHVFKKIDLDSKIVIDHLIRMRDAQSPKLVEKKKRRISVIPTADILDTDDWLKGVTVLEFTQDKKKIRNTQLLVPVLFDLLKKCLDFDEQDNVEYVKQLILGCILHCCDKTEDLPDNVFNMELVVRCITVSKNPQTHHHALLLLAQAANIVPEQVLHHIMTNFTFVGSPVLRHDDAYSFQIISKIIDSIIPLLIQNGTLESVCNVLRVFVDAILDIPEHRRLLLYKQLLTKIDPNENLHCFLLLVFEAHVIHGNGSKQQKPISEYTDNTPKRLDIAADLAREFSPDIVIYNCTKLIEYLHSLPVDKADQHQITRKSPFFDIKKHTPKQLRHYKYTIVLFITNLLSSKEFVHQVAKLPDEKVVELEDLFKSVIINILTYIQATSKVADKNQNTPQAQYWKVMLHHSYDILDSLNALLTPQMFLLVIRGLMDHTIFTVRRRALELLNSKLQHDNSFFTNCKEEELMALLPGIIKILKTIESEEITQDEELIIQTALLSLKLLVRNLGTTNTEKFTQILEFITDLLKSENAQDNILASLILCLAEFCSNLRAHAISSLNTFMPSILKILKSQKLQESPDLILLSIVTAVLKILDSLSLFLSPYLEKILIEITNLNSHFDVDTNEQKLGAFGSKLVSIKQKLGTLIPPRVLIPAVESSYNVLVKKSRFSCIGPLMDVLSENISNLKGPDVQANLTELTSFFLNTLQFRIEANASLNQANEVEFHIIRALTTLILKLSETTFRPLYYKLYNWVRSDVKSERVITFYSLSNGIAHKLKGLFVLFAGYFLNNAASLLDACNVIKTETLYFDEEEKNIILLEYVIKTLNAVFSYDTQKFINKERFELLMQPLVDQLENTLGGKDVFLERVSSVVTPCIVNFAVATADDALWKQMNYQILLKMRHSSSMIRYIALDTLVQTAKKLGEDFLPLLPETIPFLAELLEDEDEDVEKASRKAVQELEKVVGEPLEKYF